MRFTVYVEDLKGLRTALDSNCDGVRFGSEFCEWKIPSTEAVKKAHALCVERGKTFCYVTPRAPISVFPEIKTHLHYLDKACNGAIRVVVNDWGVLNLLSRNEFPHLYPHLGRQVISVPSRGRPPMTELMSGGGLKRFMAHQVFHRTNLDYGPTITFLKDLGVHGVDADWLPETFPHLKRLVRKGLDLTIHSHLSLITLTRRCHSARFLGQQVPEHCTMPCFDKAFLIKHPALGEMYLQGNAVFGIANPEQDDAKLIRSTKAEEIVLAFSPLTDATNTEDINRHLSRFKRWFA